MCDWDKIRLTSYNTRRTLPCCLEVAVSVLMAFVWRKKDAPEVTRGPARVESREVAGRASLENERVNTIVKDL
jgi:hypothetical protein